MPGLLDLIKLQALAQAQPKPLGGLLGAGPAPDLAAQFRAAGGNLLNTPIGPAYVAPQVNPSLGGLLGLGLEIAPGSGDALAIQDFNKANQVGDRTGATLAAASLIPGVGELAGAAKGLMGAKGALSMAGGLLGQTVFHGTPHDFDAFRLDKIGTGEGAQAYGHGLYFAENPEVAGSYKSTLRENDSWTIDGQRFHSTTSRNDAKAGNYAANALARFKGDKDAAVQWLMDGGGPNEIEAAQILKKAKSVSQDQGRLYTVDLPDSAIEKMLDWDKPLSEQPEAVRKALDAAAENNRVVARNLAIWKEAKPNTLGYTGDFFYRGLENDFGDVNKGRDSKAASDFLRSLGIPGIKYLDQGSRGSGNGTRNFVVFDDTLPKIVAKDGKPVGGLLGDVAAPKKKRAIPLVPETVFTGTQPNKTARWFTSNPDLADAFTQGLPGRAIRKAKIKIENPYVIDARGAKWHELSVPDIADLYGLPRKTKFKTDDIVNAVRTFNLNDGVIFKNVNEGVGGPSDVFVPFADDATSFLD